MAIIVDKDGNVVTVENEPDEARAMFPNLQEGGGGVQDVLINGTSIIDENGDANIPLGSNTDPGVLSGNGVDYGIQVTSGGRIRTYPATEANLKTGNQAFRPVTSERQHLSVFYGMAKAAGDTTQALSDNEVGNYTEAAKKAIKEMLGIPSWVYSDYRLIYNEEITNSDELIIVEDLDGNPLSLKSIVILAECPVEQAASSGVAINAYDNNVMQATGYINTATSTTALKRGFCIIDARNGLWKSEMAAFGTSDIVTLQTYTKDINVYGGNIDKIRLIGCIPGYSIKIYGL